MQTPTVMHLGHAPQANCFVKVPALVAMWGGLPGDAPGAALRAALDAAVRAQQNNETSVQLAWAAARILERIMVSVRSTR